MRWKLSRHAWAIALLLVAVPSSTLAVYCSYSPGHEVGTSQLRYGAEYLQTARSTVKNTNGDDVEVTTPRLPDEPADAWMARHTAAIAAAKAS